MRNELDPTLYPPAIKDSKTKLLPRVVLAGAVAAGLGVSARTVYEHMPKPVPVISECAPMSTDTRADMPFNATIGEDYLYSDLAAEFADVPIQKIRVSVNANGRNTGPYASTDLNTANALRPGEGIYFDTNDQYTSLHLTTTCKPRLSQEKMTTPAYVQGIIVGKDEPTGYAIPVEVLHPDEIDNGTDSYIYMINAIRRFYSGSLDGSRIYIAHYDRPGINNGFSIQEDWDEYVQTNTDLPQIIDQQIVELQFDQDPLHWIKPPYGEGEVTVEAPFTPRRDFEIFPIRRDRDDYNERNDREIRPFPHHPWIVIS
jgi:hypothetical protein